MSTTEVNIKISILVPIYNVEKYIEKCARSLFEQTYDDLEYVFVNDCTPDNSMSILEKALKDYPNRQPQVKIINHEQNQGIGQTRNTLLDNATGDYVQFVDSDDWLELNATELLVEEAKRTGAELVRCNNYYHQNNSATGKLNNNVANTTEAYLKKLIRCEVSSPLWVMLIKRSLFTDNNIRLTPGINVGEDYIVSAKLYYYARSISHIDEYLYHYIMYNETRYSQMSVRAIEDHARAVIEVEQFLRRVKAYEEYKEAIDIRKFAIKRHFLFDESMRDLNRWRQMFPESNYVWKNICITRRERIMFHLMTWHLGFLVPLFGEAQT